MMLWSHSRTTLSRAFSSVLFLATLSGGVTAQKYGAPFDCEPIVAGVRYDLTGLKGLQVVTWQVDSPPSMFIDELRFDLCEEVQPVWGRSDEDQCPPGTVACLTKINRKVSESMDRITAVIPVAHVASLNPEVSHLPSLDGLSIVFHGSSYPSSSPDSLPQSLRINLACAEHLSHPVLASYENGQATVEWNSRSVCKIYKEQPPPRDDKKEDGSEENPGSVPVEHVRGDSCLAVGAYFGVGIYRNYSNYGARGFDLIPHRDFWREVPYMLQDVVHHLCSNVRPRQFGRRGYVAV
ncbi:autophagy-related protein 27 [Pisolithus marmoratus]|nr:autophagy-related protein 27 [Pisolithus marmoratus]